MIEVIVPIERNIRLKLEHQLPYLETQVKQEKTANNIFVQVPTDEYLTLVKSYLAQAARIAEHQTEYARVCSAMKSAQDNLRDGNIVLASEHLTAGLAVYREEAQSDE